MGDGLEAIAAVERAAGQVDSIAGAQLASHAGVNVRAEGRADLESLGDGCGAAGLEVTARSGNGPVSNEVARVLCGELRSFGRLWH